jgi:hypothetical protein
VKTQYPAKVLVAWAEAIGGNKALRDWLLQHGYTELGIFVYALHLKDDARKWLLEHGFPHLMATIQGAEGNETAVKWLEKHTFDVLALVARAGDGDNQSVQKLVRDGHREMAMVALRIRTVKDQIEADHNDIHKISKE